MSAVLLHVLCLRAAGRIPDDELARLRALVARGDQGACAARLLGAFPQSADEIAALAALLPPETPLLPSPVADEDLDADPGYVFLPFPPADLPYYDRTGPLVVDETDGGTVDDLDRALLGVLEPARTTGVWRCWRVTLGPDDSATASRVYLVETTVPGEELAAVAEEGQRALAAAGHAALVEVYRPDLALPAYQWAARSRSALIWAPRPPGEVRVARADGPELPLAADEILAVVAYLRSAPALTGAWHTDGAWVWPTALADRLVAEGALTDPDLGQHLRLRLAGASGPADAVAAHRALATLVRTGALTR